MTGTKRSGSDIYRLSMVAVMIHPDLTQGESSIQSPRRFPFSLLRSGLVLPLLAVISLDPEYAYSRQRSRYIGCSSCVFPRESWHRQKLVVNLGIAVVQPLISRWSSQDRHPKLWVYPGDSVCLRPHPTARLPSGGLELGTLIHTLSI